MRKQTYNNSVLGKTTDYIDGFVFENSVLAILVWQKAGCETPELP